jgi:polygalacturonase
MRRILTAGAVSSALLVTSLPLASAALAADTSSPRQVHGSLISGSSLTADTSRRFGLRTKPIRKNAPAKAPAPSSPAAPSTAPVVTEPVASEPAASPVAAPRTAPVAGTDVTTLGAVGDGVTDDTRALQAALDAMVPGTTLLLPAGKVFAHSDVLRVRVADTSVAGGGTLLATNEARSGVWLEADRVLLQDVVVRTAATTRRWDAYEQMGVRVAARDGVTVRRVGVYGAAAAGIYVGGASNFLIDDVVVEGSRSDGIHMTEGSRDGLVRNARVSGAGDDGIAVVSYSMDGKVCARITVQDSSVRNGTWGRGFSVVGGEDVRYSRITADASNAAALYFSTEGAPYYTFSTRRVTVDGARLQNSNTNAAVDHGAIMMWNGHAGKEISDVVLNDISITDTRATAHRNVGIITEGGLLTRIELNRFTITGKPQPYVSNAATGAVTRRSWTYNGTTIIA